MPDTVVYQRGDGAAELAYVLADGRSRLTLPSESIPSSLMTVASEMLGKSFSAISAAVFLNICRSSVRLNAMILSLRLANPMPVAASERLHPVDARD
mgnify:CR=1 FL=1